MSSCTTFENCTLCRGEGRRMIAQENFWSDGKVLNLDCCSDYMTIYIYQSSLSYTYEMRVTVIYISINLTLKKVCPEILILFIKNPVYFEFLDSFKTFRNIPVWCTELKYSFCRPFSLLVLSTTFWHAESPLFDSSFSLAV